MSSTTSNKQNQPLRVFPVYFLLFSPPVTLITFKMKFRCDNSVLVWALWWQQHLSSSLYRHRSRIFFILYSAIWMFINLYLFWTYCARYMCFLLIYCFFENFVDKFYCCQTLGLEMIGFCILNSLVLQCIQQTSHLALSPMVFYIANS